jgi:hypothetical protein
MPFCPKCQAEYEPPATRCERCAADLVECLPEAESAEADGLQLVELASFPNVAEAEMIKELLEHNGIRTVVRGEADPIGVASGAAPTTLLLERRDLGRAQELYEAYFAGEAEDADFGGQP